MASRRLWLFLLFFLGLATSESSAQGVLVLSGGGSRGLAHVGVVLGLDSLDQDPDFVVGASMGAIVGSLYAAGYTSQAIKRIATGQDWNDLFKPIPLLLGPQREVRLPMLHWGIELGRFEVSRGLLPDWRVNRRLVEYLFEAGASVRGNFDELPRGYRSIAASRDNGDIVVLSRGDLARSVRASMAEPGIFSPVIWDGRVLIDGGVADYLPVSVARKLGKSPIIAADVMRTELEASPKDPIGLLRRAITLLMIRARQDTTLPDYLIVPKIDPDRSSLVYPEDASPLVDAGLNATLEVVPRGRVSSARARRRPPASLKQLRIETGDSSLAALTRAAFKDAAPAKYSRAAVLRAVDRLYATGFTESVWPRVDSSESLIVHVDPRPNGSVDFAFGYDNDRGGRSWASAQRRFSTIGPPVELELAGSVGRFDEWASVTARRASLRFIPLVFVASAFARDYDTRFVRGPDSVVQREVERIGGSAGVERRAVFPDHIVTASLVADRIKELDAARTSFGAHVRFSIPESGRIVGVSPGVEVESRIGEWKYSRAAARVSFDSRLQRFKYALVADGAITNKDAPSDVLPALGNDRAMPGMRWGEERGRARLIGGFDVAHPIPLGGQARVRARAGAAPLTLRGFESSHNWVLGAEVGAIWSLPIGSITIAGGFNGRGRSRFDVLVGQSF